MHSNILAHICLECALLNNLSVGSAEPNTCKEHAAPSWKTTQISLTQSTFNSLRSLLQFVRAYHFSRATSVYGVQSRKITHILTVNN